MRDASQKALSQAILESTIIGLVSKLAADDARQSVRGKSVMGWLRRSKKH
jgi:hypothetical protein